MKFKKALAILLSGAMMFSMAACSNNDKPANDTNDNINNESADGVKGDEAPKTISITHELGTVEVPYNPKRVAVLELAALDTLDSLGLGDRVVGFPKSSSVSYLKSYSDNENIANMGSAKEVDMEALMASEPDVIIIGGRLKAEYENLSKIAPVVYVAVDRTVDYMDTFSKNLNTIALMFGLEGKSKGLIDGFNERIEALKVKAEGKTAVVSLVTSGSINTLGTDSRCSMISNEIGFTNIATEVDSTHGDTASFELLLEKNPDYIFALDRDTAINAEGAKAAKEVLENELVMKTDAYKNGNIIYLTPDVWYLTEGGITATDIMLQDLEKALLK